jgi:hypothetical protein
MTKRTFARIGAVLLFALPLSQYAAGQRRGRWEYLGEAQVDGMVDHDTIHVGRHEGTFRAIQIKVERGAIDFQRVIVHYGNGASVPIELRHRVPAGGQTRAIDLPGDRRVITGVEFFYSKGSWGSRKPRVRLYGMK